MDEWCLLHVCLQGIHVSSEEAAVGGKPLCGLRDRPLRNLDAAEEVHDPPDPADGQTHLVMQGLEGGVQDGSESVGRGAALSGLQVRVVTTHRMVTLGARHDGYMVLGDLHGVLGGEFRDPGLVMTGEDQRSREPAARTGVRRVDLHGRGDLLRRGWVLVHEIAFTRTASW